MKQEKQKRTHIFSGSTFEELAGYSRAVVVGDHIYVSGTAVSYTHLTLPTKREV